VAVVIVCSLQIKVDGSHLNLIRAHDGQPPTGIAVATRQAASGYAQRAFRDEELTPLPGTSTWITDEFGERRMTTYRMSCQVALERYPDARRVPGTVEMRNLPDSGDEKPAGLERRNPKNASTWTGSERRRMLEQLREFEVLAETFGSIRRNLPLDGE